ncbi:MAG: arginine--tRNA ligase [Deltaproteobacteria bacterium]|nr:MAG: arginine--tRNA ligase [Deltaproteobacteria bacterium]
MSFSSFQEAPVKEFIRDAVVETVSSYMEKNFGYLPEKVEVERTTQERFGDFTTNVALASARRVGKLPRDLASELAGLLSEQGKEIFSRVEVAGPGFINFTLSYPFIWQSVDSLIEGNYLAFEKRDFPRFLVEFVSANPTGPLHIGHGRGAAFGDALCRLLASTGYPVESEYYINDAGNQMKILGRSLYIRYLQLHGIETEMPEDHYQGEYLVDLARELIREKGDSFVPYDEAHLEFFVEYAGEKILEGIRKDLEDFRVSFDRWYSEKSLHDRGTVDRSIEKLKELGFVYEKDGALWFRSTEFGDDKDRVVVRQNGEKTYFAADIAYHLDKFERGYDKLIDIWGADHHGYVNRLKAAVQALGRSADDLEVILVQFVTLIKDGKSVSMSTRAGQFETLRDVMNEVGTDAARFFYLMRSAHSHLEFDLDLAKETTSENPVYYVQYAHARICSLFREAGERGFAISGKLSVSGLEGDEDRSIMMKLLDFRDLLGEAARALEPHRIPFYLIELARLFHSYYNKYRFLDEERELSLRRLALASAVREVLKKGLEIIGVSAPERM